MTFGTKKSYAMLEAAFEGYSIVTQGLIDGVNDRTIDHLAYSGQFRVLAVRGIPAASKEGEARSDHFGVVTDLGRPDT